MLSRLCQHGTQLRFRMLFIIVIFFAAGFFSRTHVSCKCLPFVHLPPGKIQKSLFRLNERVNIGLLELCTTQTSRHDISSLQVHVPSECTTNRVLPKKIFQKPDSRPFKFYSPRIHIGERYLPIGCCICV